MQTSDTTADDTILSHHFDDLGQQKDSSTLGMWAFLATEVMLFGGLFAAYAIFRTLYASDFAMASRMLNVPLGAINTGILLCSSLTMALAVHAAQTRQRTHVLRYLIATMVLGAAFLGVKFTEWHADYRDGLVPGVNFDWNRANAAHGILIENDSYDDMRKSNSASEIGVTPGREAPSSVPAGRAQLFFVLYFLMTGLHAFHMLIGLSLVGVIAWLSHRRWFSGGGETQIEVTGLYWHFIDVVWVFLYPLLYLIDVHK